jgi:hypothetical protein
VGQHIQATGYVAGSAGWRINGDGTAEFSGVVVRGTIFASAGLIGGNTIGATFMRSNTYTLNSTGWELRSDGTGQIGGFAMTADGIESTNYVSGLAGWRILRSGSVEFSSGTYRGAVSGSQFTTGAMTGYAWPAAGQFGTYLGPSGLLIGNANNNKYLQVTADGNIIAPGFRVTNGVLAIDQANVINTLNLAGNAISVSNFSIGNNSASTNVTIPAGVTAKVFAMATKGTSSNESTGGLPPANFTLNINGSTYTTSVWAVSRQTEFSGNVAVYDQAVLCGEVAVAGPATITISASWGSGLNNAVSVFAFARWR